MSIQTPSECESTIFNATCWIGDTTLTGNFVEFPVAQGNNTLLDLTVDNIVVTGTVDIGVDLNVTGVISGANDLNIDGLSTLTGGCDTNAVNSILITDDLNIANVQSTGKVIIGGANTRTSNINIGAESGLTSNYQINIGKTTTNSISIGSSDSSGFSIESTPLSITTTGLVSLATFDISTGGLTFATQAGTAGQLLTSGGAGNQPTWTNAPSYLTGTITPASALSGSVLFSPAFATTPKITLTGFVTSGTTIIIVGVSAKSAIGFTWLASAIGLTGIDFFAVI